MSSFGVLSKRVFWGTFVTNRKNSYAKWKNEKAEGSMPRIVKKAGELWLGLLQLCFILVDLCLGLLKLCLQQRHGGVAEMISKVGIIKYYTYIGFEEICTFYKDKRWS